MTIALMVTVRALKGYAQRTKTHPVRAKKDNVKIDVPFSLMPEGLVC